MDRGEFFCDFKLGVKQEQNCVKQRANGENKFIKTVSKVKQ